MINLRLLAQPCSMNITLVTNVYVFSTSKNYSPEAIYGQQVNSAFFNVRFISTQEKKNETDSMVLINRFENSIFVFPNHNSLKMIRYCTQEEYANDLRKKVELKISDQ